MNDSWLMDGYDNQDVDTGCIRCDETKKILRDIADQFQGVLDHLYGEKSLDEGLLEFNIEEICYYLQMKPEKRKLNVKRKPKTIEPFVADLINLNNQLLKTLSA